MVSNEREVEGSRGLNRRPRLSIADMHVLRRRRSRTVQLLSTGLYHSRCSCMTFSALRLLTFRPVRSHIYIFFPRPAFCAKLPLATRYSSESQTRIQFCCGNIGELHQTEALPGESWRYLDCVESLLAGLEFQGPCTHVGFFRACSCPCVWCVVRFVFS